MLKLVKTLTELNGEKVKAVVKVKYDGSCLFFVEDKLIKEYGRLDVCLVENNFHEFLSKEYDYDEYRD